ncbi:MAG: hypothetical protein O3C21_10830 [Verrucomicrobia bacterium]|nr:hypothetical protein [Verrucomicrobiota bacterium]
MSWFNKSRLFGVLLLTAGILAIVGAVVRNSSIPPGKRDISGGLEIQRSRIDRAISMVEAVPIDEAVNSMATYDEAFELAQLASLSPSSRHKHFISQILSDRRGSKIFEAILALPPDKASLKSNEIFHGQFKKLVAEWNRFARMKGHESTESAHHAASFGIFLCSYFCDPQTLDRNLELWDKTMTAPIYDEIEGVKLLASSRFIDPLFRLNLLVISGSRNGASVVDLNKELDVLTRKISGDSRAFLEVRNLNLFRSNAETLDRDLTSMIRGVPASANSILLELPGFSDPNSAIFLKDEQVVAVLTDTINAWRTQGVSK